MPPGSPEYMVIYYMFLLNSCQVAFPCLPNTYMVDSMKHQKKGQYMLKKLVLILSLIIALMGCGDGKHEMDVGVLPDGSLPGIELPEIYKEAFQITYEEWRIGGLADGPECPSRGINARLIIADWDDFEQYCGGPAGSKRTAGLVPDGVQTFIGCTSYRKQIERQVITLDAGRTDSQKLRTFMHEAIHTLGFCSFYTDPDGDHGELYWWKLILPKATSRVLCDEDSEWAKGFRAEPYCLL